MRPDLDNNKHLKPRTGNSDFFPFLLSNNPGLELLDIKDNEDFINYLDWLNLIEDPNLVVLSSIHHYFFDAEELKNVKTVINQILLNEVKDIKSFLHSIYAVLDSDSNLIGCFIDSKKHTGNLLKSGTPDDEAVENGILSRIPFINALYNIMDSKTNRNLSKNDVTFLLENNGFRVKDITELNGISYFHAKRL